MSNISKATQARRNKIRQWLTGAQVERPSLDDILQELVRLGCKPGIYRRGDVFRCHINTAGNFWADSADASKAFQKAFTEWIEMGSPKDGDALSPDLWSKK